MENKRNINDKHPQSWILTHKKYDICFIFAAYKLFLYPFSYSTLNAISYKEDL